MGNIHSVKKALEVMGAKTLVTNDAAVIKKADKLVLPGVGAFGDAMLELTRQKLIKPIQEHVKQKKIFLGICLGMHLLFEASEESPKVKGLGILQGAVKRFPRKKDLKVPHMGWNQLIKVKSQKEKGKSECPLLKGVPENEFVYFCHSYFPCPQDQKVIAAITDYGVDFSSIVWQNNIFGVQFHPEKSQKTGLRMMKNFVEL